MLDVQVGDHRKFDVRSGINSDIAAGCAGNETTIEKP
jgi:hypothetical protein